MGQSGKNGLHSKGHPYHTDGAVSPSDRNKQIAPISNSISRGKQALVKLSRVNYWPYSWAHKSAASIYCGSSQGQLLALTGKDYSLDFSS